MAQLVADHRMASTQVEFLKVGHTHNEQDQRFSTVASLLSQAPILEDAEEMQQFMLEHIKPPRGRSLVVEVLRGLGDWRWMVGWAWVGGGGWGLLMPFSESV